MHEIDWVNVFNTVVLGIFVVEIILVVLRLFWRVHRFRMARVKVPRLLRRDVFLLLSLGVYFSVILVARVLGILDALRRPEWFVPATIIVLAAMGYWVYVEYTLDGKSDPDMRHEAEDEPITK